MHLVCWLAVVTTNCAHVNGIHPGIFFRHTMLLKLLKKWVAFSHPQTPQPIFALLPSLSSLDWPWPKAKWFHHRWMGWWRCIVWQRRWKLNTTKKIWQPCKPNTSKDAHCVNDHLMSIEVCWIFKGYIWFTSKNNLVGPCPQEGHWWFGEAAAGRCYTVLLPRWWNPYSCDSEFWGLIVVGSAIIVCFRFDVFQWQFQI